MSRVAKAPISVPSSVQVTINGQQVSVKGASAELKLNVNTLVMPVFENGILSVKPVVDTTDANAQAGTARALLANMVNGVSKGFERKLQLVGVGYKAAVQGDSINLALGFSHPVVHKLPAGVKAETPTPTEIILKGADKQVIGQTAAEIRAYRPPEPYKGKGVRYSDERVVIKETKKK
ncbi:LSU ribosomal protein L6P [Limnobacter thiooxidans]|jgi:large subunit ribosomal protein L6|uniref:Large ribosomal subunit protein uL6 n=1 Tax=Limnobacter thiooxidans TaxID=131080 RepID=A0AA86J9Q0_9BURK|nr:50S ribosomal protein L6 [Limnobacter sp.]MCZ8015093.1 50S ribosomal protein L6 [Limnobacter sp.]RZS40251.1 LSU ribosomal protein L6P [Limnobacter thiooxidans]BET27315.1 50S ribosomal protein L6 [Limnobacter thiooxidans]